MFVTNNVFLTKRKNNKTRNQTFKHLPDPGIEPGTSRTPGRKALPLGH